MHASLGDLHHSDTRQSVQEPPSTAPSDHIVVCGRYRVGTATHALRRTDGVCATTALLLWHLVGHGAGLFVHCRVGQTLLLQPCNTDLTID